MPLAHAPSLAKLRQVLRLWSIVLGANILGTLLFAAGAAFTDVFDQGAWEAFRSIGVHAGSHGFMAMLAKAVVSGWLIALMVWVLPGAKDA